MTSPPTSPRILIAGGGTGGHVIPALAIGRELRDRHNAQVRFIGTARGIEGKLVPEAGFPLSLVRSGQLKNVSLTTRLRTLLDIPLGVLTCLQLMRSFHPHVVVGVGGYASGPAMLAALLLRIPTLAYEPNAVPGLTNRLIGKRVSAAAVNFAQTTQYFRNAEITGVPVRPEIFNIPPRPIIDNSGMYDLPLESFLQVVGPRLLITAGSHGAQIFNETLPRIAARLFGAVYGLTIVHQSGPRQLESTRAAYLHYCAAYLDHGFTPEQCQVEPFLTDMPAQYAAADLVLARSGSTVAELCAAGRPSLLVPFPQAADDHQRRNAEVLAEAGAAVMLLQRDVTDDALLAALTALLTDAPRRAAMSIAARALARPGALERIAAMVLALAVRNT